MSESDLFNLARAITAVEIGYFTQMITINFAMIVAIYYFLNQANIMMKIMAFIAYVVGMALFLSEMLFETNIKVTVLDQLRETQHPGILTQRYLALYDSWLGTATAVMLNGAIWILVLGVFYLLFFWKKSPEERDVTIRRVV
ncbi:MAG: hypothetical protein ISS15_18280 [Alphaproteobacteria bacterium]|nr:hypothetical protein [Alphaproteobacteria bacterium]MBL6939019.1 hypothetical protein [Alphaproteobacteria bacterium]MBL7099611.1 hypothetical protein [Alphaproteobacteria bacterium]